MASSFIAGKRSIISDGWIPKYRKILTALFDAHTASLANDMLDNNALEYDESKLEKDLYDGQVGICVAMAVDGFELTQLETGKSASVLGMQSKLFAFGVEEVDEFLAMKMRPSVGVWLRRMVKSEARFHIDRLTRIMKKVQRTDTTIAEIARKLRAESIATSKWHAEMIARSSTIWNYNEGARLSYKDAGATSQTWMTAQDDLTCDWCMGMDGVEVPIDESFIPRNTNYEIENEDGKTETMKLSDTVEHPPLHPNCRCAIIGNI